MDGTERLSQAEREALEEKIDGEDDVKKDDETPEEEQARLDQEKADAEKKAEEEKAEAAEKEKAEKEKAEKEAAEKAEKEKKEKEAAPVEKETASPVDALKTMPPFQLTGKDLKLDDETKKTLQGLVTKLDEGEIDIASYNSQRDEVLIGALSKALYTDINQQVVAQSLDRSWKQSQAEFFEANREYYTNPALNAAYVKTVNYILEKPECQKWSDAKVLTEAKKVVDKLLGRKDTEQQKVKEDVEDPAVKAAETLKKEDAGKDSAPNIRKLPAADSTLEGDSLYDKLDKLEGPALEKALSKLTPKQQDEYLRR